MAYMILPLVAMLLGSTAAAPVFDEFNPAHTSAEAPDTTEAMIVEEEDNAAPDSLWQTANDYFEDESDAVPLRQTVPTNEGFDGESDAVALWQTVAKAAMQLKKQVKKAKTHAQGTGSEWSAWKVAKKAAKKIKKASRQMKKGKPREAKHSARKAAKHAATCVRLMELAQQEGTAWPEIKDTMQLVESCRAAQVAASDLKKAAADAINLQRVAPSSSSSRSAVSSATSPSEHKASITTVGSSAGQAAAPSDAARKNHHILMQELKSKVPVYDP